MKMLEMRKQKIPNKTIRSYGWSSTTQVPKIFIHEWLPQNVNASKKKIQPFEVFQREEKTYLKSIVFHMLRRQAVNWEWQRWIRREKRMSHWKRTLISKCEWYVCTNGSSSSARNVNDVTIKMKVLIARAKHIACVRVNARKRKSHGIWMLLRRNVRGTCEMLTIH